MQPLDAGMPILKTPRRRRGREPDGTTTTNSARSLRRPQSCGAVVSRHAFRGVLVSCGLIGKRTRGICNAACSRRVEPLITAGTAGTWLECYTPLLSNRGNGRRIEAEAD